jgi:putative ABC transport system permease protein
VTYKQERARAQQKPWWQRFWLDVLLLIPVGYGIFLMQQQGSIVSPLAQGADRNDPLQNPLFLLIPSISIFAFTLLVLRLLPALMSLISRITFRTKSIGVLMASRHLERTPGFYSAPLIMLILTFGLTTFIASLAQTLDDHLYSQQFYAYGSDMNLLELGGSANTTGIISPFIGQSRQNEDQDIEIDEQPIGPRFFFLPVTEHLKIPGVEQATRIGSYPSTISVTGERQDGLFIGVDRAEFAPVAFWRNDFASVSLGELMNRLALVSNGVLVNQGFLTASGLKIGDLFRIETQLMDIRVMMDVEIVGVVDRFPTWYHQDDNGNPVSLVVGNLDHFFEQAEGTFPYDVWLRVSPDADYEEIILDANTRGLGVLKWDAPLLIVAEDQQQPVRQGLFGVLSVGFLAAIFLTVLGFFLYSFFSFRRRFIELGVLRAIGLSSQQMIRFLAWELIFLIFTGITIGTSLGIAISNIFIPYLQIGESLIAQYPPFIVEISWEPMIPIYLLYGFLLLLALAVLVVLLMRMRIFEAVKLGETT